MSTSGALTVFNTSNTFTLSTSGADEKRWALSGLVKGGGFKVYAVVRL